MMVPAGKVIKNISLLPRVSGRVKEKVKPYAKLFTPTPAAN